MGMRALFEHKKARSVLCINTSVSWRMIDLSWLHLATEGGIMRENFPPIPAASDYAEGIKVMISLGWP